MDSRIIEFVRKYNFFAKNNMKNQLSNLKREYNITDQEMQMIIDKKMLTSINPDLLIASKEKKYTEEHKTRGFFDFESIKFG